MKYILFLLPILIMTACSYDNYDEPKSKLEGNIVYQGDPIHVSYNDVSFQLFQSGFGKETPIDVTVNQDGTYTALLFDGDYRLIFPVGQGPFMQKANSETSSDTVLVNLNGSQSMDIEVMPYYMVRDAQLSVSSRTVSGSCGLEQIITDENAKNIDYISLFVGKTRYVDGRTSVASKSINGNDIVDMSNIQLSADVPELSPTQDYVFARIGVKISGVEDMLFSKIEKVQL